MSDPDAWVRLYVARWPDGATVLLSATSLEHAADQLDQVATPSGCEVTPLAGDLWLTFRPAEDPAAGPLTLAHRPTTEIDSQAEIVRVAYPNLHRVLDAAIVESDDGDHEGGPIDAEEWRAAVVLETDRILAPSEAWRAAIRRWLSIA